MYANVLEYLEHTASEDGKKTAAVMENESISRDDMIMVSRQIGTGITYLTAPKKPVAILAKKSIETLCAFFGAAYAGCFYVMLNPQLPAVRLKSILNTLGAQFLLTDSESYELGKSLCGNAILIEDVKREADLERLENIRSKMIDTDPLYALFTSGSTGTPKGVLVSHRNVISFIEDFTSTFDITDKDVIANQAPFDFDVSVKDIYSSLKTGARLVLIPARLFSQPMELVDYLDENNVTTLIWAVSALCLISTFHCLEYRRPGNIRKVLFSGEVMPIKHLNEWRKSYPDAMFVNLYGPTEITCNCTYHIVDKGREYENGIPIGNAFKNREIILLDDNNRRIEERNAVGEICVRGSSVSLGYFNNEEQTSKAFVQNPLNRMYPDIIYKTGDLAKYNENNELVFCGRKDFQIKYMGHRIELEEIEKSMGNVPQVSRACCVFDEGKSKLYGFYTGDIDKKSLHGVLRDLLPEYMVPGILRQVDEFPINKNGKTDRKRLVELYGGRRK